MIKLSVDNHRWGVLPWCHSTPAMRQPRLRTRNRRNPSIRTQRHRVFGGLAVRNFSTSRGTKTVNMKDFLQVTLFQRFWEDDSFIMLHISLRHHSYESEKPECHSYFFRYFTKIPTNWYSVPQPIACHRQNLVIFGVNKSDIASRPAKRRRMFWREIGLAVKSAMVLAIFYRSMSIVSVFLYLSGAAH